MIISLHPGTVDTDLSRDFVKGVPKDKLFSADQSTDLMYSVIEKLTADDNGKFLDYSGKPSPW